MRRIVVFEWAGGRRTTSTATRPTTSAVPWPTQRSLPRRRPSAPPSRTTATTCRSAARRTRWWLPAPPSLLGLRARSEGFQPASSRVRAARVRGAWPRVKVVSTAKAGVRRLPGWRGALRGNRPGPSGFDGLRHPTASTPPTLLLTLLASWRLHFKIKSPKNHPKISHVWAHAATLGFDA